jgi:hypothetical protein
MHSLCADLVKVWHQAKKKNPEWVELLNSTKVKLILEDSTMQTGTTSFFRVQRILKKIAIES